MEEISIRGDCMVQEIKESKILTIKEVKELWSKTYSADRKPDWSHIFPYYHENIIFHDSIQIVKGKKDFLAMCNRLTKRCKSLEMEISDMTQTENIVMMDWKMTMSFRFFPAKPIYGATKLTFNNEGLITHQRDYYDLWGDIYNGIPYYKPIYRWFMKKFFG